VGLSGPALIGIKKEASPGVVVYVVQTVLLDYTVTIIQSLYH